MLLALAMSAEPAAAFQDTTPPPAPTISSPSNGAITNDATPQISGTAEADSEVSVRIDGGVVGVVMANGSGLWTFEPSTPLAEGEREVTAFATDAADNEGPVSSAVVVVIDTSPPSAPAVEAPASGQITSATPTFSGTAEPGSTVTVIVDSSPIGASTASTGGSWSLTATSPLSPGPHDVAARSTDVVGNNSPLSGAVSFTVAGTPTVAALSPDTGSTAGGLVVTVSGDEFTSASEVRFGATSASFTVIDDQTLRAVTPAQAAGAVSVRVATEGGSSSEGPVFVYAEPDTLPDAPVLLTPVDGAVTTDATPRIAGASNPTAAIEVFIDGDLVETTAATGSGDWEVDLGSALSDGEHTVFVTAISGGAGLPSNAVTFTVDTIPPTAPSIDTPAEGAEVPRRPTISGSGEPDTTITILADGDVIGATAAGSGGDWSFVPTSPLEPGDRVLTARSTDAAGLDSVLSVAVAVVVLDEPAPQEINFPQPSDIDLAVGSTEIAASATSGLSVVFSTETPAVCGVSAGGLVSLLQPGDCTITASQPGDEDWAAATPVSRTFEVSGAAEPAPIPTLSEWMMAVMTLSLAFAALLTQRRRLGL